MPRRSPEERLKTKRMRRRTGLEVEVANLPNLPTQTAVSKTQRLSSLTIKNQLMEMHH